MAEIRFNYGDKFTQPVNNNIGIGSTIPAVKLDVAGTASAGSLRVTGIATLSSVSGFVNTKLTTSTQDMIVEAGDSGSISGEVVVSAGQTISVSTGATTGQGGIESLKVYETFMPPVGRTVDRPTDVKPGMVFYNKDFKTIEFWDGNFWKQVDYTTRSGRGLIMGGNPGNAHVSSITSIQIPTKGNSVEFGDLSLARSEGTGASNDIRGLCMGGYAPGQGSGGRVNNMDYVTIASSGTAADFGDLTSYMNGNDCGCSSSTRAMRGGGYNPAGTHNIIDYVEIMTLGNALDFGDTTSGDYYGKMGASSPTRALWAGGGDDPKTSQDHLLSTITFVTIASKGNSTDIGDLTQRRLVGGGLSNNTRAIWSGGYGAPNSDRLKTLDYFTMASTGNAQDFGELTKGGGYRGATSTHIRGVIFGGYSGSADEEIDMVTIATKGTVEDFGNDSNSKYAAAACSDSHGGLGGF